jgi:hypothetical protein
LLCKNSVETFPRQRRIVGGIVSNTVHVVLEESRRLDLNEFVAISVISESPEILNQIYLCTSKILTYSFIDVIRHTVLTWLVTFRPTMLWFIFSSSSATIIIERDYNSGGT